MMRGQPLLARAQRGRTWGAALATGVVAVSLAVDPTPLLPVARGYRALCDRYPPLVLLTFHAPPLPLVLLLLLAGIGLLAGTWAGGTGLVRTHRTNQRLRHGAMPLPQNLARAGAELGIADRITYLAWAEPVVCCYGFVRPCIAVTAGLVARLDDEELRAVLAHERHHLRHRDPIRYLILHAAAAAAFMLPVTPALRRRQEARIELAADRSALVVAPRGALAGAMLAVLNVTPVPMPGTAGLSATEARIAHLSGRALMPEVPPRLVAATIGLLVIVVLTTASLAASADLVTMACPLCTGRS